MLYIFLYHIFWYFQVQPFTCKMYFWMTTCLLIFEQNINKIRSIGSSLPIPPSGPLPYTLHTLLVSGGISAWSSRLTVLSDADYGGLRLFIMRCCSRGSDFMHIQQWPECFHNPMNMFKDWTCIIDTAVSMQYQVVWSTLVWSSTLACNMSP